MAHKKQPGKPNYPPSIPAPSPNTPPAWISIKERVPDDEQIVLVWHEQCGTDVMTCYHNKGEDKKYFGLYTLGSPLGFLSMEDSIMWMPLSKGFCELFRKLLSRPQ